MEFVWKSFLLIAIGTILLRIAGRKSISQMTIAQTVIMISIGSLIIQPIVERSIWRTLGAAALFVIFLIALEWLQIKFNFIENIISGKAKTVIQDGKLVTENLRKIRMTVDQLEIRLRQQGISKISDVKTATIESNGQLGYELMRSAKPLTIGEFESMMGNLLSSSSQGVNQQGNIFREARQKDNIDIRENNLH